jgi:hypothetical protein
LLNAVRHVAHSASDTFILGDVKKKLKVMDIHNWENRRKGD